jgi:hypothetical protein
MRRRGSIHPTKGMKGAAENSHLGDGQQVEHAHTRPGRKLLEDMLDHFILTSIVIVLLRFRRLRTLAGSREDEFLFLSVCFLTAS